MTKLTFFILTIFTLAMSCNSGQQKENKSTTGSIIKTKLEKTEIFCDTVYPNKGYKITLTTFDPANIFEETCTNALFVLSKLTNGKYLPIFSDSIFNRVQEVRFDDYNNDKVIRYFSAKLFRRKK